MSRISNIVVVVTVFVQYLSIIMINKFLIGGGPVVLISQSLETSLLYSCALGLQPVRIRPKFRLTVVRESAM